MKKQLNVNSFSGWHTTLCRSIPSRAAVSSCNSFPLSVFQTHTITITHHLVYVCFDSFCTAYVRFKCAIQSQIVKSKLPLSTQMYTHSASVWDSLIFISTNGKLKPRQNEFISTQIFSLNKYNKIFCVANTKRKTHRWDSRS